MRQCGLQNRVIVFIFKELIELNSVIHRIECATVDLHYETIT